MSIVVQQLQKRLALFDPDEVQTRLARAQLRLDCEVYLPMIMDVYGLDEVMVLRIIQQAAECDVSDLAEIAFEADGIARTLVGESVAWSDDVRVMLDTPAGPRLRSALEAMQAGLSSAVSSEMQRVVSSAQP